MEREKQRRSWRRKNGATTFTIVQKRKRPQMMLKEEMALVYLREVNL